MGHCSSMSVKCVVSCIRLRTAARRCFWSVQSSNSFKPSLFFCEQALAVIGVCVCVHAHMCVSVCVSDKNTHSHLLNDWNGLTWYTLLISLRKTLHSREFLSSFYLLYTWSRETLFTLPFFPPLCFAFLNHLNVWRGFTTWFHALLLLIFALNVDLCVPPLACCKGSGAKVFKIILFVVAGFITALWSTYPSVVGGFYIYAVVHFVSLQNAVMYKCNTKVTRRRKSSPEATQYLSLGSPHVKC